MINQEIELGDTVKDIYTDFQGVVMAKTIFINGCVQFSVVPKWNPKMVGAEAILTEIGIDSKSLKIVKRGKIYKSKQKLEEDTKSGGKTRMAVRQRGF